MRTFMLTSVVLLAALGCARVQMQAPKEPIKVDISMRLDVYQHVEKDINAIENIVAGPGNQSWMSFFVKQAHAAGDLSPEVEQAALRRRDRLNQLQSWQARGVVGESRSGLVEVRMPDQADAALRDLVRAENDDRMQIYQAVASKNGTSVSEVQALYAKRLQSDAPSGTPVEALDPVGGSYQWQSKK